MPHKVRNDINNLMVAQKQDTLLTTTHQIFDQVVYQSCDKGRQLLYLFVPSFFQDRL